MITARVKRVPGAAWWMLRLPRGASIAARVGWRGLLAGCERRCESRAAAAARTLASRCASRSTNSPAATTPTSPSPRSRTRDGPGFGLALADHQHVGDLAQLGVADLARRPTPSGRRARRADRRRAARRSTPPAASFWRSVIGSTIACTGASQTGSTPPRVLDQDADEALAASRGARGGSSPGGARRCRRRCR